MSIGIRKVILYTFGADLKMAVRSVVFNIICLIDSVYKSGEVGLVNFHECKILNLLVRLHSMPYYRILIWTKVRKMPFAGIKLIGSSNINAVQQEYQQRSWDKYRERLIDVEVQMLSKLSTAVKNFERKEMFKKE